MNIKVIIAEGAELSGPVRKVLNKAITGQESMVDHWDTIKIDPRKGNDIDYLDEVLREHFTKEESEVFISSSVPEYVVKKLAEAKGAWDVAKVYLGSEDVHNLKVLNILTWCKDGDGEYLLF